MESAQTILVVILATFLAIFLALAIVVTVKIIELIRKVNEITDKAKAVANNVENAAELFRKSAAPVAIGRFFVNVAENFKKHKKGK
jgi:hypothetical protein